MNKCKCGSYAINPGRHGRVPEKHSDLCDVCYWRAEAAQDRADALRWVLGQLDIEMDYTTPIYDPYDSVGRERARLRAIIEKELEK